MWAPSDEKFFSYLEDRSPGKLKIADVIEEGADSEDKGTALGKYRDGRGQCATRCPWGVFRCTTAAKSFCC